MHMTQEMLLFIVKKTLDSTIVNYNNTIIDFSKKFEVLTMKESIIKFNKNIHKDIFSNKKKLISFAKENKIEIEEKSSLNEIIYNIFEETVEKNLMNPTFITEYPVDIS